MIKEQEKHAIIEKKLVMLEEKLLVLENRTKALQEAMTEWYTKIHTR